MFLDKKQKHVTSFEGYYYPFPSSLSSLRLSHPENQNSKNPSWLSVPLKQTQGKKKWHHMGLPHVKNRRIRIRVGIFKSVSGHEAPVHRIGYGGEGVTVLNVACWANSMCL